MDTAKTPGLDHAALEELLNVQGGVVARRQLRALGARAHELRRLLRRRELTTVHRGVYVDHTGPLTRVQREWAAVLACWPAALTRESALPVDGGGGAVHVAVDLRRTVKCPDGVVVHRTAGLQDRVRWNASPPCVRVEHAAIEVAADKRDVAAAFRVFADVVQARASTPARIAATLRRRPGIRGRHQLLELLDDLASGATSVLEREYLRLERLHGLPAGSPEVARQRPVKDGSRSRYQDVRYERYDLAVELDSRAFHDNAAARDEDAERDLDHVLSTDGLTVRLTYGQVFRRGCTTLAKIARLLERRGWPGPFRPCPSCPTRALVPPGDTRARPERSQRQTAFP